MNELAIRNAMKALAKEAAETVASDVLTGAEKATKLEQITTDMKTHSDAVSIFDSNRAIQAAAEIGDQAGVAANAAALVKAGVGHDPVAQLLEAKGFKEFAELIGRKMRGTFSLESKAYDGDGVYQPTGNGESFNGPWGSFIVPQQLPGYVDFRVKPLMVENVLPSGSLSSPVLWYVVETIRTNLAAAVAEGGTKPQGTYDFDRKQEVVTKIAEIFKLADEVLLDASQARTYINQRLQNDLGQVVQDQLLNGDGTSNKLTGLNQRSGLETAVVSGSLGADSSAWATAILRQITQVRTIGFTEPTAIFINPLDWEVLQNQTDANGQYFLGGPYANTYGDVQIPNVSSFWSTPLVSTLSQPQGTALVGNFNDSTVWNYQGITMDMTNSDGTDFANDLLTFRAERRVGLSLTRPLSLGKVTLTP